MAKLVLTKDPSHKGYYQDPDGNLYVFRFGGRPIKVDGYREDKPKENIEAEKVEVDSEKVINHKKDATEAENDLFKEELEKEIDGPAKFKYEQEFHLNAPVNDYDAAQKYLSEDDMSQYLPEELKESVRSVEWKLDDEESGKIEIHTTRELTPDEQSKLNDWIEGQNSDGLGEGFEQQDFAESYFDPESGDGPYTRYEAEEEINRKIENMDERDYRDYIDESEIEAGVDTYIEENDLVQEWKENYWGEDLQEELLQYCSTDEVIDATRTISDMEIDSIEEARDWMEDFNGKDQVAEELWQNLSHDDQADLIARFDQGDDLRSSAKDEVLSDPESYISNDAIADAKTRAAMNTGEEYNIEDWYNMSSIRSNSKEFSVSEIEPEIKVSETTVSTHDEEITTPGKEIKFNRNHPTFRYSGSYSDNDMKMANEYSEQIQKLGDYVLDQYEKGNITYDKAYDLMEVSTNGVEGIKAGLGFYHMRNNNLMKDTLHNTEAGNELINQMSYYKDNLEEMHKRLDLTVYDKGDYSSLAIKDKRYEILDESSSAFGTELYKLKDDEGNIFYKPKDEVYRKPKANESLQMRYSGTIASLQAEHPDWSFEKIMEKIRKIDED